MQMVQTFETQVKEWRGELEGADQWLNMRFTIGGPVHGITSSMIESHLDRGERLRDQLTTSLFFDHVPETPNGVFECWFRAAQVLSLLNDGISRLELECIA